MEQRRFTDRNTIYERSQRVSDADWCSSFRRRAANPAWFEQRVNKPPPSAHATRLYATSSPTRTSSDTSTRKVTNQQPLITRSADYLFASRENSIVTLARVSSGALGCLVSGLEAPLQPLSADGWSLTDLIDPRISISIAFYKNIFFTKA